MKSLFRDALRVLFFCATSDDLARLDRRHLYFGLTCTWLVGMGRWWDDPRANLVQHLGLGSLAYVFVLAAILWFFTYMVSPRSASYVRTLTYVTLTAPPALLYAIPIERWTDLSTARTVNVWFLGVVASWRVALYFTWLIRGLRFPVILALCTGLLPIVLVIAGLAVFNVERAVFDLMSGLRADGTQHDEAYAVLVMLTFFSIYLSPVLLVGWIFAIAKRPHDEKRDSSTPPKPPSE